MNCWLSKTSWIWRCEQCYIMTAWILCCYVSTLYFIVGSIANRLRAIDFTFANHLLLCIANSNPYTKTTYTFSRSHIYNIPDKQRLRYWLIDWLIDNPVQHSYHGYNNCWAYIEIEFSILKFLPARRYASAGLCYSNVSVRPSVRHAPVLCQNEES